MWRLRNLGCYADVSRRHELSLSALDEGAMVATWNAAPQANRALATVSDELRFTYANGMSFEARTGLALTELGRRLQGIGWLDLHEAVWLEGKWNLKGSLVQRRLVTVEEEG